MLRKQRILVGSPVFSGKDYCIDEWIYQAKHLTYPVDIMLVDNSADGEFAKYIRSQGINCIHIRRKEKSEIAVMAESHEALRQHAVNGLYDFLFHWEVDVELPYSHIIEMLLAARKKVIGCLYHISLGEKSKVMVQLMEQLPGDHFQNIYTVQSDAIMFLDGRIKNVSHCGLGALLIHKSVLNDIIFRYEPGKSHHPDTLFAVDLARFGHTIYVDSNIICKHHNVSHGLVLADMQS